MSQYDIGDKKQQVLTEIDGLRSDVSSNPKIRLRAQAEIFELLDKAVEDLDRDDAVLSLSKAASKVKTARKRVLQAENQEQLLPWLPAAIGFFLVAVLAVATWAMVKYGGELFVNAPGWSMIIVGAVLWGTVGSATDGLRELHTRVARQELDVNRLAWYLAHPIIGAALGGILVFVIYAGLLTLTGDVDPRSPALIYGLAALAGFAQRQVIQSLREALADVLHIKREGPEEAG